MELKQYQSILTTRYRRVLSKFANTDEIEAINHDVATMVAKFQKKMVIKLKEKIDIVKERCNTERVELTKNPPKKQLSSKRAKKSKQGGRKQGGSSKRGNSKKKSVAKKAYPSTPEEMYESLTAVLDAESNRANEHSAGAEVVDNTKFLAKQLDINLVRRRVEYMYAFGGLRALVLLKVTVAKIIRELRSEVHTEPACMLTESWIQRFSTILSGSTWWKSNPASMAAGVSSVLALGTDSQIPFLPAAFHSASEVDSAALKLCTDSSCATLSIVTTTPPNRSSSATSGIATGRLSPTSAVAAARQ